MNKIGIIDSGVGGISTLAAIRGLLPHEEYVYIADRSGLPYGDKTDDFIINRMITVCDYLRDKHSVKTVVIACNTATAAGIERLREVANDMIFVGVEPAVRPAVAELKWGKALVLVTPAAARQNKFLRLTETFKSKILIAQMPNLATLIENNLNALTYIKHDLRLLLEPFKDCEIESVVLGCTHYCFVSEYISNFLNAKIYDGNAGAAVRLYSLLKEKSLISRKGGTIEFVRF